MGKAQGLLLALALLLLSLASLPAWCIGLSWGHALQKESAATRRIFTTT